MEHSKESLLIDAIVGRGFRDISHAVEMQQAGFAKFSGNQWNEDWSWVKEKLEKLNEPQLEIIYNTCRGEES